MTGTRAYNALTAVMILAALLALLLLNGATR